MADSVYEDGSIADLPWGAVFDPVVNARALSAVQARGFRAAREVVDRFISMAADLEFSAPESESRSEQQDTSEGGPSAPGGIDVERALGTWQSMLGQLANSVKDTFAQQATSGPAMFDLRTSDAAGQVVLNADGPGAVSTEVWLHNGGPEDMGKVRLRCSDLLAHDGAVIESDCVRFEPDVVAMPARSSRGIIIEVDVADDHAPGSYRGTLLADGQPDVWLPVLLVVASELNDR
ncbi:hypothetical protein [Mycolicibacterium confluentis]|uniref:Uncharacterized protein n=1 Tax=Mycolicibacterium confluentis TaxID=28047 RepID=A0A7I7Y0P0_9MYCO|nr:hypothetical protein [Mycolicibacterium confluentis]MCV7320094.1 hypothetical protein [Mycolicibacterium confluentis]BBZ35129.1 hypothetical protein MCNF_37340 [Mycolicibacterium confluentis]